MPWSALAASALIAGCANSPPAIAPALLAEGHGSGKAITASVNLLSNYGKTEYYDSVRVERSDGQMVQPYYMNIDMNTFGMTWRTEHAFFACYFPNLQVQAYAGLRWGRHAALGYFPTFVLLDRDMLHGIQLDLNGFDRVILSASLYQDNSVSVHTTPAFGEPGYFKALTTGSMYLNIPWRLRSTTVWMIPNYRRSLDHPSLARYGMNVALSFTAASLKKPPPPSITP